MLPKEFVGRMKQMLGKEYEEFESCYDREKHQALRFNPLKGEASAFLKQAPFSLTTMLW